MLGKRCIRELLSENYPLIAVLVGVALISLPMGPFRTLDTQLEFDTTLGVIKYGYPYINAWGNLFNVPPLGFYTAAVFFLAFGATLENGVVLVTLFGLASAFMVYKLGKELYSKSTGLFASALFALTPWQLILSRAFLIDAQCLFLSLVFFYFGVLAIRKSSIKFAAVSGIFFALAFLTKQYAVFMLVPLLLLYLYQRPKRPKQIIGQLTAFSSPAVFSTLLWYQIIMGKELFYLLSHNDFNDLNFPEVIPSYTFITTFLIDYGLGILFVAAVAFSLILGVLFWKRFSKQSLIIDSVCLATILSILGLVMYMGVNLNLKAPYTSAIKYIYQSLPFFSLIVASLAVKSVLLLRSARESVKLKRVLLFLIGFIGLLLLVSPIISNIITARQLTTISFLIMQVQPGQNIGYSFHVLSPLSQGDPLLTVQLLGFIIVLSGLSWAGRYFMVESFKPVYRWIRAKKALRIQSTKRFKEPLER